MVNRAVRRRLGGLAALVGFGIWLGGSVPIAQATPRITSVSVLDSGGSAVGDERDAGTIDVVKATCSGGEAEPFYDTYLKLEITNDSNQVLTATGGRVRLRVSGQPSSSLWFAPVGASEIPAKSTGSIIIPAAKITASGSKALAGRQDVLQSTTGFANGFVELRARVKLNASSRARTRVLKSRMVAAIGEYDRCE